MILEKKQIEHTVVIDDSIRAIIKIPLELDALELKALMHKANKLFNLAEVPIREVATPKTDTETKTDRKEKKRAYRKKAHGKKYKYSHDEKKDLVLRWYEGDKEEQEKVMQEIGKNRTKTTQRMWYWRDRYFKDAEILKKTDVIKDKKNKERRKNQ